MSSSKNLYKSRLFNFINRQRIRFNDQLGITIRNIKVTTQLGIKGWLYPFIQMLSSDFSVRRQLKQKIKAFLLLSPSNSAKNKSSTTKAVSSLTGKANPKLFSQVDRSDISNIGIENKNDLLNVNTNHEDNILSQPIAIQNPFTSIPKRFAWAILNRLKTNSIIPQTKTSKSSAEIKPLERSESFSLGQPQALEKPKLLMFDNSECVKLKTNSFLSSLVRRLSSYTESKLTVSKQNKITQQTKISLASNSPNIGNLFQQTIKHFFRQDRQLLWSYESENITLEDSISPITTQEPQFITLTAEEYKHLSSPIDTIESFQQSITPTDNSLLASNLNNFSYSNNKLEFNSDLLEVKAITIGYVKNVSDFILELLDRVVWWIEELGKKIWHFFNRIFSR